MKSQEEKEKSVLEIRRIRLYLLVAIALVVFLLWSKWNAQFIPKTAAQVQKQQSAQTQALSTNQLIPTRDSTPSSLKSNQASEKKETVDSPMVSLKTDVLKLNIDLNNGNIIDADLLKYPQSLHSKTPVEFLYRNNVGQYIAQTGLYSSGLPSQMNFKASQTHYVLPKNNKHLKVNLYWSNGKVEVIKTYTLNKGSYEIGVNYTIKNVSDKTWTGQLYGQVTRTPPTKKKGLYTQIATYTGGVISTPSDHYQKVKFSSMKEGKTTVSGKGGWASMVEHYFITAWIPSQNQNNQYFGQDYGNNNFAVGSFSPKISIASHASQTIGGHFYIGPTLTDQLAKAAPKLTLTIDYGWLWFISKYLFMALVYIHHLLGNWGWSIVVITLLIKLVFYPLSKKSYVSMAKVKSIQPKVSALQKQHASDRQALQKATMQLYQKEGVNPIGGCLPMLIQIPIFIGLYWMLMASVELRQAPWALWIKDLSVHDPYYILPILTGLVMLVQQLLSPKPADKTQAYMMMGMPVLFTFFMLRLPAGLGLYMVVNIGVSILQQKYVMYSLSRKAKTK